MKKQLIQNIALAALVALSVSADVQAAASDAMPKPRAVSAVERTELTRQVVTRFGQPEPAEMRVNAAGPYRFANGPGFLYIDRTDVGSMGFENVQYGINAPTLDRATAERGVVLGGVERALQRAGVRADGLVFDSFNDEYEGATQPDAMQPGFDPRQASRHVTRTAVFTRQIDGVPVFGSELMVGLMPDGTMGRFRMHWPALDAALVHQAAELQQAVQQQRWAPPSARAAAGEQILETRAGVLHTGFAEPGFEARAVVRLTVRRSSGGGERLALSSTGYRYYDGAGNEVKIGGVPATAGTPADRKAGR